MVPQGQLTSAESLLDAALTELGFADGELFEADKAPSLQTKTQWTEKGDWLALAKSVGVESVFFVDQHPVVVFAKSNDQNDSAVRNFYNRIWCMARPQLLFLARPGELAIYDLGKPPVKEGETIPDKGRRISDVVKLAAQVQTQLAEFRREEIESGRVFGDARFGGITNRADRTLIRDLRIVREALLARGLDAPCAHALIGRSIFIRYLEDRKVLVRDYFESVAENNKDWAHLLSNPSERPVESDLETLLYPRVLKSKDFTYALFEKLAEDFNGDTFPIEANERKRVKQEHLDLLRRFLLADAQEQQELFFFAYRFDIIPIELISSIYEEFYNEHRGKDKNHGSHYTPSVLVDFVLSRTLTSEILDQSPRVIDPACGSGIFLVESFRRIVRYSVVKQDGKRLSRPQLRRILRDQIAGIDINEEAIRVAAFSLYLAFLHYQEPREINEQRRLPNLKWVVRDNYDKEQQYDILLTANAFDVVSGKLGPDIVKQFGTARADIVVGNPPWGYPKKVDEIGWRALDGALAWCTAKQRTIGDKELSQSFIHLSLELLREGGRAGLLVSSGIFFKHHPNSRMFRQQWLSSAQLQHVVNFAHVRQIFFRGDTRKADAIAPFAAVVFQKCPNGVPPESRFAYWSAKRTVLIENAQAIVLSKADMHWLAQQDCLNYEKLWKIYWWGGHRDEALMKSLERFPRLSELPESIPSAKVIADIGFVEGKTGRKNSGWLKEFRELPVTAFERYGPLSLKSLRPVPELVRRRGSREAYEGHRLLLRRGVPGNGTVTVRLENRSFCFRHSIFAIRLIGLESWQEKVLLGILWSSLSRYYLFLATGSWGMWHDELNMEVAGNMPVVLPADKSRVSKIIEVVEKLQAFKSNSMPPQVSRLDDQTKDLENELDDLIFDLYQLNRSERELVQDMCKIGLDFLYRNQSSIAVKPVPLPRKMSGTQKDIANKVGLELYLSAFLQSWNPFLETNTQLSWHVLAAPNSPLLAVLFSPDTSNALENNSSWTTVLSLLDKDSRQPAGSRGIYTDTFVRFVDGESDQILIVKRNERRFWTSSAAREDAEATQLQAMRLQEEAEV